MMRSRASPSEVRRMIAERQGTTDERAETYEERLLDRLSAMADDLSAIRAAVERIADQLDRRQES